MLYMGNVSGRLRLFIKVCYLLMLVPAIVYSQGNPMLRQTQTRAVIIGISDYQNITDLDFAHRDAEVFAEYLQSAAGGNVPADNIRLLLNEEATQMQMAMALDWLQEESRPGDRVYIYFSGHGDVEKKTSRQRGFLLTHDAPTTTYMAGGAFPIIFLQDVISALVRESEAQVILIADACRAGKLAGNSIDGNHVTAEELSKSIDNEIKILSCQPRQLSQESERWGGGRGVFSYHLIEGLVGLANPLEGDEVVNLMEIRRYLEDNVGQETTYEQVPMVEGPPNFQLALIDRESLAALRTRKSEEKLQGMVAMKNREPVRSIPDTNVWRLYLAYKDALRQKKLLYPTDSSAYDIYQQIKNEPLIQPYRNEMKREMAVALHDEAQQAINNYLQSSPQELRLRWSNNERYEQYPEYLGKAAALLGPDHFMYEDLITRQLYFEGVRLRLQGQREERPELYAQALVKQQEAVKRDPSAAYAYNELGLLYRRMKDKQQAEAFFYQALEQSPTWILPMANLITNHVELKQLDSALLVGARALAIDSTFALTYHNLGFAYETGAQWPEAVQHYEQAIRFDPDYANSYYNLGFAHYHLKAYDSTLHYFLEYLQRVPDDAPVWGDAAFIAGKLDKKSDELTYLRKAFALEPENNKMALRLAGALIAESLMKEGEEVYFMHLSQTGSHPDKAQGHYQLALYLAEEGLTVPVLEQLEKAVAAGFKDRKMLEAEEKLQPLRQLPRFINLLKEMK